MKIAFFYCIALITFLDRIMAQEKIDYIKVSQELLYAAKTDEPTGFSEEKLAAAPREELAKQLKGDRERKAFWLNIYNGYTQIRLKADPGAYKKRGRFFSARFIHIAGETISLDLVEHGILRRGKAKYSLGHFNKLFKTRFEKQFRVEKPDYRIHFALNCGAKSCPPIAFYKPVEIDQQLDLATKVYLKREVIYDENRNKISLPALLSWFRGDFGNKKGILVLLRQQELVPATISPGFIWKKYDWGLLPKNFD